MSALRSRPSRRARPDEPLAAYCQIGLFGICNARAEHRHHRRLRSQGGGDEAANTLDICGACHDYVHANPAWAYDRGYLLRAGTDGDDLFGPVESFPSHAPDCDSGDGFGCSCGFEEVEW